jgi:hypothetical protein
MAKGGARQGAGRKRGIPNKVTAKAAKAVADTGKTPLDVMIANMRFADEQAAEVLAKVLMVDQSEEAANLDTFNELLRFRNIAQECAKDAAPYVHSRLSSIQHTGKDGNPIKTVTRIEIVAPDVIRKS